MEAADLSLLPNVMVPLEVAAEVVLGGAVGREMAVPAQLTKAISVVIVP